MSAKIRCDCPRDHENYTVFEEVGEMGKEGKPMRLSKILDRGDDWDEDEVYLLSHLNPGQAVVFGRQYAVRRAVHEKGRHRG